MPESREIALVPKVTVITGAGAGVGRTTVEEFARQGYDIGLLSRDPGRLECAALKVRRHGGRALAIPTDVANADDVEAAASRIEAELGPIDVWVNVAMATVFAPVSSLTAAEVERGTRVTYLGQVHGMMSALKRMRVRNHGVIVNVGLSSIGRATATVNVPATGLGDPRNRPTCSATLSLSSVSCGRSCSAIRGAHR